MLARVRATITEPGLHGRTSLERGHRDTRARLRTAETGHRKQGEQVSNGSRLALPSFAPITPPLLIGTQDGRRADVAHRLPT